MLVTVLTVCSLLFGVITGMPALAATFAMPTYDYNAALTYAANNVNSNVGLCAEFVWRCLNAGGALTGEEITQCSALWTALDARFIVPTVQLQHKTKSSTVDYIYFSSNDNKIAKGDPIFSKCFTCNQYPHVAICAGGDNSDYVVGYARNGVATPDAPLGWTSRCSAGHELVYYAWRMSSGHCANGHTLATGYFNTATTHWRGCKVCGERVSETNHTWVSTNGGYRCTVCFKTSTYLPAALPEVEPIAE